MLLKSFVAATVAATALTGAPASATALTGAPASGTALTGAPASAAGTSAKAAVVTGTYSGGGAQWAPLPPALFDRSAKTADTTVVIDPSRTRQKYTGIGISIDETSVSNLWKLTPAERDRAIRLLVDPRTGAGLDRFRLTIGSPDLIEHLPFWSYDELPPGVTSDWDLKYFSIQRDIDLHMVDTIKLIRKYNPKATFLASAWSAPAWMKTNNRFTGEVALKPGSATEYYQVGKLRDDCIDVFARYYVKYIQAYRRQGINIDALTLLNEPGMDVVYPAMDINIDQQVKLSAAIKRELRKARLSTELYVHDFNFWDWRDPNSTATKNYHRIFEDPAARRAADGIAFHPYWGDPAVMRDAYEEFGKPVHLTETSDLSPATVLNDFRLDASSYILWAQATDQDGGTLHWTDKRDNNVDWAEVGRTSKWPNRMVKVDTTTKTFTVRDEPYQLGQFARHLGPGHVRVQSSAPAAGISNVVFRQEARHGTGYVAVVGNSNDKDTRVRVTLGDRCFVATVPAGSYATYRWTDTGRPARHNQAPRLAAVPAVTADQYASVRIPLRATDRDQDRLSFYATDLPAGVRLDADTGLITLTPTVAGQVRLTVAVTDGRGYDETTVLVTVRPHGAPAGATVEAEAYAEQHGWTEGGANFVENNPSASGGRNVGWTAPGNWLSYDFDLAAAGTYQLEIGAATGLGAAVPDAISVRDASGTVLATVTVPDTGGWGTFRPVRVPVTVPAGAQRLTVYCEAGGFNLDYLRLTE
ncbi:carbohydrate-binding protein [Actinoplanes sp. DH11]|uniref:carbohydrate-binding protein n=1 Tax=Actinoplanes sp. DH11 TaxID=2857011 RepID=UPI001E3E5C3C|nr:carbohydrate-binding protein [Actinoplanes sp. DH11]